MFWMIKKQNMNEVSEWRSLYFYKNINLQSACNFWGSSYLINTVLVEILARVKFNI